MPQPEIDVRIDKSGKVTVTVSGVSGGQCLRLSDAITEIIGTLQSRVLTSEYHNDQRESTTQSEQRLRSRFD